MLRKNIFKLILIGLIIYLSLLPLHEENQLAPYLKHYVKLLGKVCQEVDLSVSKQRITFCVDQVIVVNKRHNVKSKVLLNLDLYPSYHYADYLLVQGYLQAPKNFSGFKYDKYLSRFGIYSIIYYPRISFLGRRTSFPQRFMVSLLNIKHKIKRVINSNLPEPESSLSTAILLGDKHGLLREDTDTFSRIGLSHMIAISGSHIAIISALILSIFGSMIGRKKSLYVLLIFLFIYPLFTGLHSSAIRSSLMSIITFLSIGKNRSSPFIALLLAATLMLLFNPKLIHYDIGFQLSFLAVLGIIYLYPIADLFVKKINNKFIKSMGEIINLTLVSQIVTLPIILINFHQLSLIAPLANVLIIGLFPILLASLILAIFFSLLIPYLSLFLFWSSHVILSLIFFLAHHLANISWASIQINSFTWKEGIVYYLVLVFLYIIWYLLYNIKTTSKRSSL